MYWLGLLACIYYLYGFLTPLYSFQLFSLCPTHVSDMVGPAWSLRYEVAFYYMFGLCLLPYAGRWILGIWIYSVFAVWAPHYISAVLPASLQQQFGDLSYRYAGDFISPFEFYFFAGLLCGWVYRRFNLANALAFILIAAGVIGLTAYWTRLDGGHGFGSPPDAPVTGLCFGLIILGLAAVERSGLVKLGVNARRLGMLSYPLYILHDPLMNIVNNQFGNTIRMSRSEIWPFAICLLIVVFFICAMIAFLIDRPLQRLLRRIDRHFATRRRPA